MQCSAEAGHGVVAYAAQALLERATQADDAAEPGLKHGGCMHILPPSVAAIALKILPMISLIRSSPPLLLTGWVVLDSEEREVKVVFVVLGSCAGTSALPGTSGAPACSFPYGSPGHVVEEDRIALPFGEAKFVSQVLRIGNAENIDRDTPLQLA